MYNNNNNIPHFRSKANQNVLCKYATMQLFKYGDTIQVCKYANMQVYKYACMHIYASMQFACMHVYASMQVYNPYFVPTENCRSLKNHT